MLRVSGAANVVLIGMPYVGKSTVGMLLAKALGREFLDTDLYFQAREGRRLQDIINSQGPDEFCRLEERYVLSIRCRRHVIATGGSVVYSAPAMEHLKTPGVVVYLRLSLELLKKRIDHMDWRGVVMGPGETLDELFVRRAPLYSRWADLTVDCDGCMSEQVVGAILKQCMFVPPNATK